MTKFFQKYQKENRLNMTRNKEARRKRAQARPPTAVTCSGLRQMDVIASVSCLSSKTSIIISGDKHLLDKSGFSGINVLKPRNFVDQYFS